MKYYQSLLTIVFIFLGNLLFGSVSIMNGLTHIYEGKKGETLEGFIELLNTTDVEQRVTFAMNDALFSCTAGRVFSGTETHELSSKTWFEGELSDKVLKPREKYTFRFKINIPEGVEKPGSYWSMLMVSVEKPIKEELLDENIGLDTKIRYAVGLLTNVEDKGPVIINFEDLKLNQDSLSPNRSLSIKIKNDGAFVEATKVSLEIYNNAGEMVKVYETERNLVFPGYCKDFILNLSELEPNTYKCLLLAESREEFSGSNITLNLK